MTSKGSAMGDRHAATGPRPKRLVVIGLLVGLLVVSAAPGHAQRGGHSGSQGGRGGAHGGHGGHGGSHGGHGGHGGHGVFRPHAGVFIWPYWNPYWDLYVPPPSIVTPPPRVYVEPAPPTWYYCVNPPGYYPYVYECPGGWQPVAPPP